MPIAILVTSLLVLSQSAIFIRFAHAHAAVIGFWRLIIALPVLLFLIWQKKLWKDIFQLKKMAFAEIFLCGFFLFLHFLTWFLSVQKTSVANSMILFASNPVFTAIGAWIFFKEKIKMRHIFSLLFCFSGIFFLVKDSLKERSIEGDILAVACAILFSAYILSSKGIRQKMNNIPFVFLSYSFCAFFFLITMLYLGLAFFGYSYQTWAAFAALGFGSTLLGHALFTHSLQFFNVNFMSISTLSEPIATVFSAHMLFGEVVTSNTILGFLFISTGILVLYFPYLRSLIKSKF